MSTFLESPMREPSSQPTGRPDSLDRHNDETGEHEYRVTGFQPSSFATFERLRLDSARHVEACRTRRDASPLPSAEEILAIAAQELRLPLSHIKEFVTALLRTDIYWDEETRKEFITEIDLETDRLAQLVESQLGGRVPGVGGTAADQNSTVSVESQVIVLALSKMLEAALMIGAVRVDTMRYLLNETNPQGSWQAIKAVFAAQVHLSREPVARLAREILAPERPEQLTDRELEVLRLVARGCSNKQIARGLTITLSTVKTHVTNILGKLGVESRTQAALHAGRTGLVPLHELASTGTLPA